MPGTLILFPVCSELLLIGSFENLPFMLRHTTDQITNINTIIANKSTKQLYARNGDFKIKLKDALNVTGNDLSRLMK